MKRQILLNTLSIIAIASLMVFGMLFFAGCGETKKVTTPTDFEMNYDESEQTLNYSFTPSDDAAYYYIRAYQYNAGTQSQAEDFYYSTRRLRMGGDEKITGSIDIDNLSGGIFKFNLVGYSADSSVQISDPAVVSVTLGGLTMQKPEFSIDVKQDENNNPVTYFCLEGYTLYDYYTYQVLDTIKLYFYSDNSHTNLVKSFDVDISVISSWVFPPNANYIRWMIGDKDSDIDISEQISDLPSGTYYVGCQAIDNSGSCASSEIQYIDGVKIGSFDSDNTTTDKRDGSLKNTYTSPNFVAQFVESGVKWYMINLKNKDTTGRVNYAATQKMTITVE